MTSCLIMIIEHNMLGSSLHLFWSAINIPAYKHTQNPSIISDMEPHNKYADTKPGWKCIFYDAAKKIISKNIKIF